MFKAIVCRKKKCPECDEFDYGFFERMDHGCLFEVEIGEYDTLPKARLAAMGAARAKGRGRHAGICTGDWSVESGSDGVVASGQVDRERKQQ